MNMALDIDRKAIHEAGHAFVCLRFGVEIEMVTIIPDRQGEYLACVKQKKPIINDYNELTASDSDINLFLIDLLIDLSGYVAQKIAIGNVDTRESLDDLRKATRNVGKFVSPEDRKKYLIHCIDEVKKMINENWSTVEAIANELIEKKTLSGSDIEKIVGQIKPLA